MQNIQVSRMPVGELEVNCYLVENLATRELFFVDPGADAPSIIRAAKGRRPVAVLLTHGHFDHIGAVDTVCTHFDIPLYLHEGDIAMLTNPLSNVSHAFGEDAVVRTHPIPLREGQRLPLLGMEVTVWHTPGHTRGGACFLLPEGQGIFTGDTLFHGGYGRTDFPGGDFTQLKASLRRLLTVSPKQRVYPGHGAFSETGEDAR